MLNLNRTYLVVSKFSFTDPVSVDNPYINRLFLVKIHEIGKEKIVESVCLFLSDSFIVQMFGHFNIGFVCSSILEGVVHTLIFSWFAESLWGNILLQIELKLSAVGLKLYLLCYLWIVHRILNTAIGGFRISVPSDESKVISVWKSTWSQGREKEKNNQGDVQITTAGVISVKSEDENNNK
ncbi:hypothetical protein GWI33_006710 [Rhynchophorus ferrugineus]|uniref:Uncharacterized protein n=1 Tax=Rhynchophorus ferrugineus TaxID=354439 RepID=A0A834IS07_RHYFE|nr:hypothetical protein GWI33_006710 [Rhynchophorus ferrugineus]